MDAQAGRVRGLPVALILLLVALPSLGAAQDAPAPLTGSVYVDDVVVVAPDATLTLGPGVQVTGPGRFEVWGSLVVAGTPASRAEVAVPVLLLGNGSSRFEHAHFYGAHDAAITVRNGSLDAHDVEVGASGMGLEAGPGSFVELRDVAFRDNAGAALRVQGAQNVAVSRSLFVNNGKGVSVASGRILVQDSTFHGDGTQVEVAWTGGPMNASFARNDLAAQRPTGGPLVVLRGFDGAPSVQLTGNRVHGAAVGVLVAGPGPALESRNDTFDDNVVGLSLNRGVATLVGTRLGNTKDVEGATSADALRLDNVTFLRPQAQAVPVAAPAPFPWLAPLGLGAIVLVGVLAAVLAMPARRRAQELPEPDPAPPAPPPAPVVPIPAPRVTPQELRVLQDVVANPGSAQAAVAQRLGMTRQALHYHVKKLEARGLLVKEAKGRETLCRVPPEVAAALEDTRSEEKA